MLHKNNLRLLLLALVLSSAALAQPQKVAQPSAPDLERLRAHVAHLASDKLEGRKTGTPGAEQAAEYIAAEFKRLRLAPGGNTGAGPRSEIVTSEYLQRFPYVAAVELGQANAMTLTTRAAESSPQTPPPTLDLRVGEDWMPLGFSSNARVESAPVVFVGYGIVSGELNVDDYAGADLNGRVALAWAGTPDGDNPHGRFARFRDPRLKAAAARGAGAKALVLVAREDNFKDDKLTRLSYENGGGDAGLPVAIVSRQTAGKIFGGAALREWEAAVSKWFATVGDAVANAHASQGTTEGGAKFGYNLNARRSNRDAADNVSEGVRLALSTDIVRREAPAANVVGILEGSDPKLKNEVIVVGAHYDHLGRGGRSSLAGREGDVHYGADDNASGTAALIELARLLSAERERIRRTVVFIAFGGEEEGLLGSSHYVNNAAHPLAETVAMINMDMVGRLRNGALMVGGVGTAVEWRGWLEEANADLNLRVNVAGATRPPAQPDGGGSSSPPVSNIRAEVPVVTGTDGRVVATADPARRFHLRLSEDGFGPSDHSSFYARRIPVLFFFTGSHEDYHKPTDTADRINYDGLASIVSFVRDLLGELQAADKRPTFTVAKVEQTARRTGFNIYLGTVPSYGESTDGMKLDAVREGSPAEKAGLRAGDRIVKMAGREVRNVYDYTQALSVMKAGAEYEVEIVRDGQRLTLKITPAARR